MGDEDSLRRRGRTRWLKTGEAGGGRRRYRRGGSVRRKEDSFFALRPTGRGGKVERSRRRGRTRAGTLVWPVERVRVVGDVLERRERAWEEAERTI